MRRGLRLDDTAAARAKVAAEKEAGATYFILDLGRYADEQSFGKSVETFMSESRELDHFVAAERFELVRADAEQLAIDAIVVVADRHRAAHDFSRRQ